VTTQLRLVEPPEPRASRSPRSPKRRERTADRPRTATVTRSARAGRAGRRSVNWGDWHLDARTRQVGRAGVARAREALEAALEQELSQAS
jgi:hypothetical protein